MPPWSVNCAPSLPLQCCPIDNEARRCNVDNIKAQQLINQRKPQGDDGMVQLVVWQECVPRYDNETGKGDHKHWGTPELAYSFVDMETLVDDLFADVRRWNDENGIV